MALGSSQNLGPSPSPHTSINLMPYTHNLTSLFQIPLLPLAGVGGV